MGTQSTPIYLVLTVIFLYSCGQSLSKNIDTRSDRDLVSALFSARPGDVIRLTPDTTYYLRDVEITRSGHPQSVISLVGDKGARIISDNTALIIKGSFWKLENIAIENSRRGIIVTGNNNTFKSLSFHSIDDEGLDLRGHGNSVRSCVFNGVSHGVVIYGKENYLHKNSITCSAATVTASQKSCCGRLDGNVFNGLLNIFGADYEVYKNVANSDVAISGQRNAFKGNVINGRLDVTGCGNSFHGNTAGSTDFTSTCYNWDDGGNKFGTYFGNTHNNANHYPSHSHSHHNHN